MPEPKSNPVPFIVGVAIGAVSVIAVLAIVFGGNLRRTPVEQSAEEVVVPAGDSTDDGDEAAESVAIPPSRTPLPAPRPVRGISNVYIEYIFDASGSMSEYLDDGVLKSEAAAQYLIENLLTFNPETHFGLRAFGHNIPWEEDFVASCADIELIAPVETGQLVKIADWLEEYDTLGETPLYASILAAFDDFETDDAQRLNNIVLISDGNETCFEDDPCQFAADLVGLAAERGIKFSIHVVGLDVDSETRTQLECIADQGGGVYYDVHNSDDLQDALQGVHQEITADEEIVTFEEATQIAMAPSATNTAAATNTPRPSSTPRPSHTPAPTSLPTNTPPPTSTPRPTNTPGPTNTPAPTVPPTVAGCARPTIVEFYAASPATCGPGAPSFVLHYSVQGADRVEIFGNALHPQSGTFDVWDPNINYWVLWAKVNGTPDDCFQEEAILVNPDDLSCHDNLDDVTVDSRNVTISVRDNAQVDGDIITLSVNGQTVLNNFTLSGSWHDVPVTLNSGANSVVVTAMNEGSNSPNTVEVRISNVTSGNGVQVSSGLSTGQSESFNINAP